ncbi:hypothetical protein MKW92_038732 [Papaver armeniacum]|nr:hypothetical protein MKW92_038732 [Papaver armeniacum]
MASSVISSAAVASVRSAAPAQASMVAPFSGLKSVAAFPVTRKSSDITSVASNGGRVWPPTGLKKFETLSYLPPLTVEQLSKEIDYLLRNGWVPYNNRSPGYYDGRYWTMWKLPMFGCTDASQVIKEVEEAKAAYPDYFIRIIGFDNVRQVQCISFIAYKPENNNRSPGYFGGRCRTMWKLPVFGCSRRFPVAIKEVEVVAGLLPDYFIRINRIRQRLDQVQCIDFIACASREHQLLKDAILIQTT